VKIKFIPEIKTRTLRQGLNRFDANDEELIFKSNECRSPEPTILIESYYQYLVEHTINVQLVMESKSRLHIELLATKANPQIVSDCLDIIHREQEKLIATGYYSLGLLKVLSLFHHIDINEVTYEEIIKIKKLS